VPVFLAPFVGLVLGVLFAWAAWAELARDDGPLVASRPFAIVVAFTLLVFTPIVSYFAFFHGDWAYVYLVPWHDVPSAVDVAFVLLAGGMVLLGFVGAAPLVRRRKLSVVASLAVAPGSIALAFLALFAKRMSLSATYAQFHGEFGTEPLTSSALGRGVLVMGMLMAAGVAWSVRALWAMSAEAKR
jgi:hypothetical protein